MTIHVTTLNSSALRRNARARGSLKTAIRFFMKLRMRSAGSWVQTVGAAAILGVAFILSLIAAMGESQTTDEAVHLSAGMSYWKTGDFRLNPEHPPLLKYLAALPLLPFSPSVPTEHTSWEAKDQWAFGRTFLYENRFPPDFLLLIGRLPTLLLAAALGFAVWRTAVRFFGDWAGLVSVTLIATNPIVLAHGHYVTTDVGAALTMFLAVLLYRRWDAGRTVRHFLLLVLMIFVALMSKYSGLFVIPVLGVLAFIRWVRRGRRRTHPRRTKRLLLGVIGTLIAFFIAGWALYTFEVERPWDQPGVQRMFAYRDAVEHGTVRPAGILSERVLLWLLDDDTARGQWIERTLQNSFLPAFAYVRGFGAVVAHSVHGHDSYLLGMVSGWGGWWWYFPFAFLVKSPTPMLLLLIAVAVHGIWLRCRRSAPPVGVQFHPRANAGPFLWVDLLVPPALYLAWSMASDLNLGVRHLLPVYPFIAVAVGSIATVRWFTRRWMDRALWLAVVFVSCSIALIQFPHYLPYTNALIPEKDRHLLLLKDSNNDWGQDLKHLRSYLRSYGQPPYFIAYYGQAPLSSYGIVAAPVPTSDAAASLAPQSGTYAVSISSMLSQNGEYRWLLSYEPTEVVGGSILIYTFPRERMIDQSR